MQTKTKTIITQALKPMIPCVIAAVLPLTLSAQTLTTQEERSLTPYERQSLSIQHQMLNDMEIETMRRSNEDMEWRQERRRRDYHRAIEDFSRGSRESDSWDSYDSNDSWD